MASQNVIEFTADNWEQEVLNSDKPVVVDFWAPWCGPCRMLGPTIDRLAEKYAGKVKVGKLNVDDAQELAAKYGITSIPRVYIFKNGTPVADFVGLQSEDVLAKAIDSAIG